MEGLHKEQFRLKSCDLDVAGKWRLSAVFTEMQEVAAAHTVLLGCSREDLLTHGIVWILSRVHLEMAEYPGIGDVVVAETWHGKVASPFFPRYFRFTRPDGTLLGQAATSWLLFHLEKRELLLPRAFPFELIPNENLVAPFALPKKMRLGEMGDPKEIRRVRYTDLDFNQHMNNTKYMDWICDLLGFDVLNNRKISSLKINFDQEARPGEDVALYCREEAGLLVVCGKDSQTNKMIFESTVTLK